MARNQSVPISLARSNTRLSIGSDITTMTIATSTSSLSLESMPSMHSTGSTFRQAQSARYRATSHDSGMDMPVPRPSMASISTAGFMEANDPQLSLRFLLNQPNTMYGVVKRERPTKTWFGPKNTYTPYITALYGDKLIMYHASRSFLSRYKMASRQESINGPFYSAGSTIQFKNVDLGGDFGPRPSQTTSNPATPPQFSSSSLYQPPSYVLRLTVESEIHVSELGVYVLKVTGKKIDNPADVTAMSSATAAIDTPSVTDLGILADKTWLLQFDNPDSMMEWMARIKKLIVDMATPLVVTAEDDL